MKRNFVVVAADSAIRESLAGDLRARGYTVTRAASAAEAEKIVRSVAVDAVLAEAHLPDARPEELIDRLKKARPECRVVVLTSFEQIRNTPEQLRFGSDDYIVRADQVLDLVEGPFATSAGPTAPGSVDRGVDALIRVVDVLVGLLEVDDRHFGGFSHQATRLARELALELKADEQATVEVVLATLLRDIGKAGLDPQLLSESGWFDDAQRERMRAHIDGSVRLLEHIDFPWKVLPVIRHHHERYDGGGYPDGLRGREIPMAARIVAVVDAYVALTSGRQHRDAFGAEQALTVLVHEAGRQFDPEVIEALQRVLDKRNQDPRAEGKPRALIVDEQDDFRKLIKMRLVNDGFEVDEVADGEHALEVLLKRTPDVVLADVNGDDGDAFRLLGEMREEPRLALVPVGFLSRRPDRVLKLRALREGVDDFFYKGDDLEELVARVRSVVKRELLRRDGPRRNVRRGITGDLENLGLADIVQTLAMGMKTACVTLIADGRAGRIWFENGAARHAEIEADSLHGEVAFYEMVRWTSGHFTIEHGAKSKRHSLKRDSMYLVMEGLRLMDESRGDAAVAAS